MMKNIEEELKNLDIKFMPYNKYPAMILISGAINAANNLLDQNFSK